VKGFLEKVNSYSMVSYKDSFTWALLKRAISLLELYKVRKEQKGLTELKTYCLQLTYS
jgi:hypothetical protein